jgi:hypothetical protein
MELFYLLVNCDAAGCFANKGRGKREFFPPQAIIEEFDIE